MDKNLLITFNSIAIVCLIVLFVYSMNLADCQSYGGGCAGGPSGWIYLITLIAAMFSLANLIINLVNAKSKKNI